jgi:glycosyltransferase involved in cell wall biosynthesis
MLVYDQYNELLIEMQEPKSKPLVSIAVSVYNHEAFIAKAIDSILMQKTNFDFEIVIGDDFSTDGTGQILQSYKLKYPGKIALLHVERNQGVFKNAFEIYKYCHGKYIAMLEGDDYWTSENKLQKQVDFLESHSDYIGCFHDAEIISSVKEIHTARISTSHTYSEYKYCSQFNKYNSDIFPWDLLTRTIIPTASFVFRNLDLSGFFDNFGKVALSLQWAIHLYIIRGSKFKYFNEVWSVYNDHPAGVTKTNDVAEFNKSNIIILKKFLRDHYYRTLRLDVKRAILREYRQILYNKRSYGKPYSFFLKNYFAFWHYSFSLFFSESYYFLGRSLKKAYAD